VLGVEGAVVAGRSKTCRVDLSDVTASMLELGEMAMLKI
jgi:hypothetical protein